LEGGIASASRIAAIVRSRIPVCGHIGVMPQTASMTSGFGLKRARERLLAEAKAIEEAGAFAIVLEMVDYEVAAEITAALKIPTIGIGSGAACDAQVLVLYDMLGVYPYPPSFVKRFADIDKIATGALRDYAEAVREGTFPPRD
jgi:3-methyl-2-oxobutanoate hydroxymethyltransferase